LALVVLALQLPLKAVMVVILFLVQLPLLVVAVAAQCLLQAEMVAVQVVAVEMVVGLGQVAMAQQVKGMTVGTALLLRGKVLAVAVERVLLVLLEVVLTQEQDQMVALVQQILILALQ
jgi:hypothetical protein